MTIPESGQLTAAWSDTEARLRGHVLVVEDNAVNRMLLGAFLDRFGLSYDLVASGEEALRRLNDQRYDLILLDLRMPGLDGWETLRRLRTSHTQALPPVIALSAADSELSDAAFHEAGFAAHLAKPITGHILFDTLARYLPSDS